MLYFAYGSNMSTKRLASRVSSARKIGIGELDGHGLVFRKKSKKDGSAKCDIAPSSNNNVIGIVFDVPGDQMPNLDRIEGLGNGYDSKMVTLHDLKGNEIRAKTYYATSIDINLKPYHWYKYHVVAGAREHNLPDNYIRSIESVESIEDPCNSRAEKEMAIYS